MIKPIVFLVGNDREEALYRVAGRGIRVSLVIGSRSQSGRLGSWRDACDRLGVPFRECEREEANRLIAQHGPGVLVSIGFPLVLAREVLDTADTAINVHPTLLPRYRGALSGFHIIANNERQSGVTIHKMTERLDAGDIICQRPFDLSVFDTTRSMMRKSRRLEAEMLADVLTDICANLPIKLTPQDESQATAFLGRRTPDDSAVDPGRPLSDLYDHIRACDPARYPAFFVLNEQRVSITLSRQNKPPEEFDMI